MFKGTVEEKMAYVKKYFEAVQEKYALWRANLANRGTTEEKKVVKMNDSGISRQKGTAAAAHRKRKLPSAAEEEEGGCEEEQ